MKVWDAMPRLEDVIRRNLESSSRGVILNIIVQPGSPTEGLVIEGSELVFQTVEPEGRGRENAALVRYLSKNLNIPVSKIDIVYGTRERYKRVLLMDINEERLITLLSRILAWPGEGK
jgi:uncharacterized protein YggU (UPF0235/DUF167 family)